MQVNRWRIVPAVLALALTSGCCSILSSPPQCGGMLDYGQSLKDALYRTGETCEYRFQGTQGDAVTIAMSAIDGGLDPFVELYGPDGELLASDDDGGGGSNSRITRAILPSSGGYTIVARDYAGDTTGTFELSMVLLQP